MHASISKEFRPLVLPWSIGVLTAIVLSFNMESDSLPSVIPSFVFYLCLAILCSAPFGAEFQQRTFGLLLAQPVSRSRLWRDKMLITTVAVATLGLLRWRIETGFSYSFGPEIFAAGFLLLSAVCTAGIWIRRMGSTGVGLIAGIATQLVIFSVLYYLILWWYGAQPLLLGFEQIRILIAAGLIYSGLFVWLGWAYWKTMLPKLGRWLASVLALYASYLLVHSFSALDHPNATTVEGFRTLLFVAATISSSCLWTLTARSTLGGIVFNAASLFIISLLVIFALEKLFPGLSLESRAGLVATGAVGVGYSALFLWLGWRKFTRLELREAVSTEGIWLSLPASSFPNVFDGLRCRPTGALANLVRKELRLQTPVVMIATVFTICWLVLVALRLLAPQWRSSLETLFLVLTSIYIFLSLLLAGAISLGEEKALTLVAWHLTLPVSARHQWLVKVAVGTVVGLLLGLVLPAIYAWLTFWAGSNPDRLLTSPADLLVLPVVLFAASLVVTIGLWAATFAANTLRAILTGLASLAVIATALHFGHLNDGQLAAFLLTIIVAALWRSFLQFRRPQPLLGR